MLGKLLELALVAALVVVLIAALALWAHHRRRIAEIHELDPTEYRGFRRVNRMIAWPKYCLRCGMIVPHRTQLRIHLGYFSPCTDLAERQEEELEEKGEPPDTLRVLDLRRVPKTGEHAIDTMFQEPAELEAGEQERT